MAYDVRQKHRSQTASAHRPGRAGRPDRIYIRMFLNQIEPGEFASPTSLSPSLAPSLSHALVDAFSPKMQFFLGLIVGQLAGSWLLALLLPALGLLMRFDLDTRRRRAAQRREAKKNRYPVVGSCLEPTPEESKFVDILGDREAWKRDVGAPQVEKAWALFAGHIVQEFIYDTWYSSLTPDTEFPASIRALLNAEFGRLARRAKKVNLMLLVSQALDLVVEQIEIFRDAKDELRYGAKWSFEDASDELNEKMIRMQLKKDCNLHPSMQTGDGHYKVLKQLAEVAVTHLDPPVSGDKVLSKVVCRELLAGSVFRKLIQLCTCYNIQKWLILAVDRRKVGEQPSDESRPTDDMRGVWAQEQKIEHFSQAEATLGRQARDGGSGSETGVDVQVVLEARPRALSAGVSTGANSTIAAQGASRSKFRGKPVATVATSEIVNATGSFHRDFVVYSIRVGDDRGEWTVSRRFRHFEQLHRALRSQNIEGFQAVLPSKYFFRDLSPQYVEARRVALNEYLQRILEVPAVYASEFVWEFLKKRSERYQVMRNGDTVGALVKHHFDNVVSATCEATRLGQNVSKGVGKGVGRGMSKGVIKVGKVGKGARDYLFPGCAKNSGTAQEKAAEAVDLQLIEDEINLGMPGQRISPAYYSADLDGSSSTDEAIVEGADFDTEEDMMGLLLHPTQSVAGSLYEFLDCVFLMQDRGAWSSSPHAGPRQLPQLTQLPLAD